jgi:hypothetical protein
MISPVMRIGLLLALYAGWTIAVASAYYVVPDAWTIGLRPIQVGGPHTEAAIATAVGALAGATGVVLAALALGTPFTRLLPSPGLTTYASYALACGFVVLSLVSQALAYAGVYTPSVLRVVVLVLAVAGLVVAVRAARYATWQTGELRVSDVVFVLIAGVGSAFALIGALAPEIEYDAAWYHLWLPQQWLSAGRPVDIVEEYISLYPLGWDLAYGAALTLGGVSAAKLLHWLCLPLMAVATWLLCREIAPRASAVLAATVAVTTPTVLWEATTAYVDIALAWYVALASFALVRYHRTSDMRWLMLSALTLGGAMAIKHLGLVVAAILGIMLLVSLRRAPLAILMRRAIVFAGVAMLVPLPWYARAYAASGNPVFPDLYAVFGAAPETRWSPEAERGLAGFKARFGRERTVANLVKLPWDATVHSPHYGGALGPLFLLLVPVGLLGRRDTLIRVTAAGVAGYVVIWASPISSFQMRFLLPLVPFLAVIAAAGAERLTRQAALASRAIPPAISVGIAVVMLFNLQPFTEWHDRDRHHGGPWLTHVTRHIPVAVVTGAESPDEYLRRHVTSYAAWQFINAELPRDARVLTFSGGDHLYSARPRLWSDATMARHVTWGARRGEETAALIALHELGVTHVLFDEAQRAIGALDHVAIASEAMKACCLVELYRDARHSVHALVSAFDLSRAPEHQCGTPHASIGANPSC